MIAPSSTGSIPGPDLAGPRVSIVIPSYNCERYIRQTLDCVVSQTYPHWELVVVDDQSTDRTVELARAVDPRIRVVQQKNAGVCVARNRGLAETHGEFVCFLDHDDYWYPEKLELQVGWMDRMPEVGLVFSAFIRWHADSGAFADPEQLRQPIADNSLDPEITGWVYHKFLIDCEALTSSAMIRRSALDTCGAFDTELPYSEDWDLFLRLSRQFQFARMAWPSTLYRQHQSQGSRAVRETDYRTELVMRAARLWGLSSPDGQAVPAPKFRARIADFRMQFGHFHLAHGSRRIGVQSLLRAWATNPARLRYLQLALAGLVGWRPKV